MKERYLYNPYDLGKPLVKISEPPVTIRDPYDLGRTLTDIQETESTDGGAIKRVDLDTK